LVNDSQVHSSFKLQPGVPNGRNPSKLTYLAPERTLGVLLVAKTADFLVGYLPKPQETEKYL
jgi:hypothetical protein